MTVLDYILCGFEEELTLERELGVRTIECDRALLVPLEATSVRQATSVPTPSVRMSPPPPLQVPADRTPPPRAKVLPVVFLHDRPFSEGGIAMMAKIFTALGLSPETAPIVFTGERPAAKVTVVLGANALRKWMPGLSGAPGQWLPSTDGSQTLVTYSPEYILRFGAPTPAVMDIKKKMWNSLKAAKQRAEITS